MRRRDFIYLFGGVAAAWPRAAHVQQAMPVVGYISGRSQAADEVYTSALREGLAQSGFVDGKTMMFYGRWVQGQYDRAAALTADLIGEGATVIVVVGTARTLAAMATTATVPIVFVTADDAVDAGLVTNLSRPSGNATGVSMVSAELRPKMLQLLREIVPQMKMVVMLVNPQNARGVLQTREMQTAASRFGLQMQLLKADTAAGIELAFAALPRETGIALVVASDPFLSSHQDQIVGLATRYALPAIYPWREYVLAGGLVSYGSSNTDGYRQAGLYVGRILKGAKPADLPVQQPTKFELVINLKTAKALGLDIPPALLARAEEVIE